MYSKRIEGMPIKIRIKVGVIVQNSSNGCDSIIILLNEFLKDKEIKLYLIITVIRIKIVMVWSWKNTNSSIRGEAAF
jgi:hypothetical protein